VESLEMTSENRHRRCERDLLGQTVPSTGSSKSSNREGPVADNFTLVIYYYSCRASAPFSWYQIVSTWWKKHNNVWRV